MLAPQTSPGEDELPVDRAASLRIRVLCVVAVFASLMLVTAVRYPVPTVNEPHFLTKAKHYWDTEFCPGDFFLDSSNTHLVFYQTIGLFTKCLTLDQTAWVGRGVALWLLAIGWCELFRRLVPGTWSGLWAAWLYSGLTALANVSSLSQGGSWKVFNLSGEWVLGGVEAKVVAYAFVFWAMALAIDRRPNRAAVCAGAAVSFHPVVGCWSLVAAGGAGCLRQIIFRSDVPDAERATISARRAGVAAVIFVLFALPGLLPALAFLGGSSGKDGFNADYIQVYYRLKHHLNPRTFPISAYASYVLLALFWWIGRRHARLRSGEARFSRFVLGSIVVALVGLLIGLPFGPQEQVWALRIRVWLLKFYPFRLADTMIPIAAVLVAIGFARTWVDNSSSQKTDVRRRREVCCTFLAALMLVLAFCLPKPDRVPSRMKPQQLADWREACDWIRNHTPHDALVHTPNRSWAFKWYAQRAEYVSFKDCPQDSAGIVEWNNRLRSIRGWAEDHYDDGEYSASDLAQLRSTTGITHMLLERLGPIALEPIFRNGTYRVYRLPDNSGNSVR